MLRNKDTKPNYATVKLLKNNLANKDTCLLIRLFIESKVFVKQIIKCKKIAFFWTFLICNKIKILIRISA